MNSNGFNQIRLNFSGLGCWLTLIAVFWLLGAIGLGWIIKSAFVLLLLLILAPAVGFLGLRWWFKRNLVQAACPVCGLDPMVGLRQSETTCPSCGSVLQVEGDRFKRTTADGTIDVDAVEISAVEVLSDTSDDSSSHPES